MSTRTAICAITGNGFLALSVGFCTLRHQTPVWTFASRWQWRFPCDVPDEAREFSRDGSKHTGLGFAGVREVAEPLAKTGLRLPTDILDLLRQVRGSFGPERTAV